MEVTNLMEPLKQTRKHFSRLGLFFFLGTIIVTIVQVFFSAFASLLWPDLLDDPNILILLSALPMYLLGMPALIALVSILPAQPIERHKMKAGSFVIAVLMTIAIMYVSNYIGVAITTVIGLLKGSEVENVLADMVGSLNMLLMFVYMVVCAPLMEEYVFRKLIVDRTVRYGQGVAVVLSGLMFALFHGNLNQFIYTFTLGMFLAFLYVKTGNLKITIALHAIVNFLGSILAVSMLNLIDYDTLIQQFQGELDSEAYMAFVNQNLFGLLVYIFYVFCLFGVVIAGGVLFIVALAQRKLKLAPGEVVIPKGKRFKTVILNVGMLLYCIIWIATIISQLFI